MQNSKTRLEDHNSGKNLHTKEHCTWQIKNLIAFSDSAKAVAFERNLKTRSGRAFAKQKGKYKGRKPTAREKAPQVTELLENGMTKQAIADQLDIGVASVYRIIKEGSLKG